MGDNDAIRTEIDALSDGAVISDGCARAIAAQLHSPSRADAPMSALSHTGAIDANGLLNLIARTVPTVTDMDALVALRELARYVHHHGPRGPVAGWSNVWVR